LKLHNKLKKTEEELMKASAKIWDNLCEKESWDRFYK
jgi:hypothetical protein